jgi:hypothetical protein
LFAASPPLARKVIKPSGADADLERVVRTYRISRGTAIYRVVFATVWFVAFICCAFFFRDPNYPADQVVAAVPVLLLALWPGIMFSREPVEVVLAADGVCEFRAPLRTKRVHVEQIKSIKGDNDDFVIRYEGGRVHLEGDDFLGFLIDLVQLNPAIEIKVGEWFGRILSGGRAHAGDPTFDLPMGSGSDDWIRQFREPYSESRRRQDRIDRLGYSALILVVWFWFSFMSWGLSFLFFQPHSRPTWLLQIAAAASFGMLVALVWFHDDRPELSRLFRTHRTYGENCAKK